MKIKAFIIILYIIAGLIISTITAVATYIIIGVPIGKAMILKIIFTILFMLPLIGLISYLLGSYLSKKFDFIKERLEDIKKENFFKDETKNTLQEINDINQSMNFLSVQMNTLIKDLKQRNQNLSTLLISMAHDIKTPITILNGYIEEIEDDMIPPNNLPKVLSHMKSEVNFLNELTIDMLEYITSMQSNKKQEIINLYGFIQNEVFSILEINHNIKYINNIDEKTTIKFNKIDLKRICINIITNAIRHTKKGYIKISNDKNTIIFGNNGEEIEEKYKNQIFEPFFTISQSKNRQTSSFGLGLSIVKNLSNNNNHDCFLHSSSKNKTVFYLEEIE